MPPVLCGRYLCKKGVEMIKHSTFDDNEEAKAESNQPEQSNQPAETIPFNIDNMVDLLTVYNAYLKLEDVLHAITEIDLSRGLLWEMRKLDDLLQNLSPVFDPDLDYDEQEYSKIIANRQLDIRDKARRLMGYVNDCFGD